MNKQIYKKIPKKYKSKRATTVIKADNYLSKKKPIDYR